MMFGTFTSFVVDGTQVSLTELMNVPQPSVRRTD